MRMLSSISPELSWPIHSLSRDHEKYMIGDLDKIVNELMSNEPSFQPKCDIAEMNGYYFATFDIPGVKKEDIKIEILGNQMVISGDRKDEIKKISNQASLFHERLHGKFERSFSLPTTINKENIEAHYEDGVLSIAIPKAEIAQGRTVQVQTGQDNFLSKLLSSRKDPNKEIRDIKAS